MGTYGTATGTVIGVNPTTGQPVLLHLVAGEAVLTLSGGDMSLTGTLEISANGEITWAAGSGIANAEQFLLDDLDSADFFKWQIGGSILTSATDVLSFDGIDEILYGSALLSWKAGNTELDANGNLIATNATLSGTITASAGDVGGWTINSTYLAKDTGTDATSAGLAPADYPFYAGSTYANRASAPFRVTPAGVLVAENVVITSGEITFGAGDNLIAIDSNDATYRMWIGDTVGADAPFSVTKEGYVYINRIDASNYVLFKDMTLTSTVMEIVSNGGGVAGVTGIDIALDNAFYGIQMSVKTGTTVGMGTDGINMVVTNEASGGTVNGLYVTVADTHGSGNTLIGVDSAITPGASTGTAYAIRGRVLGSNPGYAAYFDGRTKILSNYIELNEMTEPSAPGSNIGLLYMKDNGSGKSQLCVRFATGAVQVLATEP